MRSFLFACVHFFFFLYEGGDDSPSSFLLSGEAAS